MTEMAVQEDVEASESTDMSVEELGACPSKPFKKQVFITL